MYGSEGWVAGKKLDVRRDKKFILCPISLPLFVKRRICFYDGTNKLLEILWKSALFSPPHLISKVYEHRNGLTSPWSRKIPAEHFLLVPLYNFPQAHSRWKLPLLSSKVIDEIQNLLSLYWN